MTLPDWAHRAAHSEVEIMAGLSAGLVTAAEVNSQPDMGGGGLQPAQWSTIWFVVSVIYLVGIYYGMIHVRGSAA
jgi:hypothetical protein